LKRELKTARAKDKAVAGPGSRPKANFIWPEKSGFQNTMKYDGFWLGNILI